MRFAKASVLAFLSIFLASTVFPQQSGPAAASKDVRAITLVQKALAAMGASQLVDRMTVSLTGTLTLQGSTPVSIPITIKARGSNQLRTELSTTSGIRVTVFSEGHGTMRQPNGSIRRLTDDNAVSERNIYVPALSLLSEYQLSTSKLEYVGSATTDGIVADVVAVGIYEGTDSSQAQKLYQKTRTLFCLDPSTGYVLRLERAHYSENIQNSSQTVETRFSDWRQVDGVAVPFRQQTFADGRLLFDLVLSSVIFNTSLSDSDFVLAQ